MKTTTVKNSLKALFLVVILMVMSTHMLLAQTAKYDESTKQELINLSKQKWQWMADKNVEPLDNLFHAEAVFVHMGATMSKEQELNTIKSGGIHYKNTEIHETSVRFIGNTAIVLDRITLTAIVGGNEVVNPFMCTEVYVQIDGKWKLGSLSFTRLMGR